MSIKSRIQYHHDNFPNTLYTFIQQAAVQSELHAAASRTHSKALHGYLVPNNSDANKILLMCFSCTLALMTLKALENNKYKILKNF